MTGPLNGSLYYVWISDLTPLERRYLVTIFSQTRKPCDNEERWPGFEFAFTLGGLHIGTDRPDTFHPDDLGKILSTFLEIFRPDDKIFFNWVFLKLIDCEAIDPQEIGHMVVSARSVKWISFEGISGRMNQSRMNPVEYLLRGTEEPFPDIKMFIDQTEHSHLFHFYVGDKNENKLPFCITLDYYNGKLVLVSAGKDKSIAGQTVLYKVEETKS